MYLRIRNSVPLFFAIAVGCLLVVPGLMAATPGSGEGSKAAAPRFDFRYENDAYAIPAPQTEQAASKSLSRLSIRLYGAYSDISAADVNDGSDGLFELLALYGSLGLGTTSGGYNPVHWGYNVGGDLIYQISPRFGIGVGAGYVKYSRSSLMSITTETVTLTLSATPALSAVPIRLGVFLNFPIMRRLDLTVNAGGSYYAGLKFKGTERVESGTDWQNMSVSGSRSSLDNLGFQGSLGFEYKFSPKMGVFVEAEACYARFKNLDSVTATSDSSSGGSSSDTGKLYIAKYTSTDGTYSTFVVEATPPVDTADTTYREPKFDLSGIRLQAGFRIRF